MTANRESLRRPPDPPGITSSFTAFLETAMADELIDIDTLEDHVRSYPTDISEDLADTVLALIIELRRHQVALERATNVVNNWAATIDPTDFRRVPDRRFIQAMRRALSSGRWPSVFPEEDKP